jgi:hypothetical protein
MYGYTSSSLELSQHIHFAAEPRHLRHSDWANVLLKVDLHAAISAGIEFCRAVNGVVLSEGPIPVEYLKRVGLKDLPPAWSDKERLEEEQRSSGEVFTHGQGEYWTRERGDI